MSRCTLVESSNNMTWSWRFKFPDEAFPFCIAQLNMDWHSPNWSASSLWKTPVEHQCECCTCTSSVLRSQSAAAPNTDAKWLLSEAEKADLPVVIMNQKILSMFKYTLCYYAIYIILQAESFSDKCIFGTVVRPLSNCVHVNVMIVWKIIIFTSKCRRWN